MYKKKKSLTMLIRFCTEIYHFSVVLGQEGFSDFLAYILLQAKTIAPSSLQNHRISPFILEYSTLGKVASDKLKIYYDRRWVSMNFISSGLFHPFEILLTSLFGVFIKATTSNYNRQKPFSNKCKMKRKKREKK